MSDTNSTANKFDNINFRLDFIKYLLNGKKLDPLVEVDCADTEALITHHEHKSDSEECNDIRCILNKKALNFNKIINQIGGKLLYIKSGTTGHTFKGMTNPDDENCISYAVKIVAYPKREGYGGINDIRRPENAELLMLRVLSYFVINNQTPHIVLPIGTFNTSIITFLNLSQNGIVNNKKYDEFLEKHKKNEYYNEVSVLISEWANGGDLLDYLRNNYTKMTIRIWRVIFFQLLSVLAVIQEKYQSFRHNDLKANNVLIQKIDMRDKNNKFKYKINHRDYIVPNIGLQVKIWDFDFACIPGVVDNAKVNTAWCKKINITSERNRYYDVHYFFNTLTKKGFLPQFFEAPEIPRKVKEFIRRVIPDEYAEGKYIANRGRILVNKEYTTPDQILKSDPFFDKMRPPHDKVNK
jgi:serine/threonine protein kinase